MNPVPGPEAALAEIVTALRESGDAVVSSLEPMPSPSGIDVDALAPRCALCRLADRSAERSLRAFFSEFVNDPEVRIRFRKSRGFCRQHTPLLARCGDALGVAILYADLADETRRRWRSNGCGQAGSPFSRWLHPNKVTACPACGAEEDAEARYSAALASGLARDPGLWEIIQASSGLCARHVEKIAIAARPRDAARLLEIECARMDGLFSELEEFVRKNDYRFRTEPWGAERDAWRRALLRLRR